jgi:hypothetical protein
MIMKIGEFQYYYCLWFDAGTTETTGTVLKINVPFNWDPKKPLNHKVTSVPVAPLTRL